MNDINYMQVQFVKHILMIWSTLHVHIQYNLFFLKWLKCPYYGLWKVHILVLGVPNNRLTWMRCQKYIHCLIICIYYYFTCSTTTKRFAQQYIFHNPSFAWCKPVVIGPVGRFHFHFIKQYLWVQCCFVYSVTRKTKKFAAAKAVPSGKEWITIFIQTNPSRHEMSI